MSTLAIVAIIVAAVWLAAVTLVILLVVRQIALLTARVEQAVAGMVMPGAPLSTYDPMADGPQISERLPDEVLTAIPELASGRKHVALLSATCTPCRTVADGLSRERMGGERGLLVALVPGRAELADVVADMLPAGVRAIRDPEAGDLARSMGIQRVPFAFRVDHGVVTAKMLPFDSARELLAFIDSVEDELKWEPPPIGDQLILEPDRRPRVVAGTGD